MNQVQIRMPAGERAMRLQAGHDAEREITLAGERTDRGGDGVRGQAAMSPNSRRRYWQYARNRLGIVSTTCRCGTRARSDSSSHSAQRAGRLA